MRASDLYRGVTRLTDVIESTAASTVGTMIQPRLRLSAEPSARKSSSPVVAAAVGFAGAGAGCAAGCATGSWACAFSLPVRQNAKPIALSRGTPLSYPTCAAGYRRHQVITI